MTCSQVYTLCNDQSFCVEFNTSEKNLIILYLHRIKEEFINDIDMGIRNKYHS